MTEPVKRSGALNQSPIPAAVGGGGGPGVPALPNSPQTGTSPGGPGVLGQSNTGAGLRGESIGEGGGVVGGVHQAYFPPGDGVFGHGATGVHGVGTIGVYGVSEGNGQGVLGESTGNGPGVSGSSKGGDGVYGTSAHNGVHGHTASSGDSGVWGDNTGGGFGVSGSTSGGSAGLGGASGAGVWGNSQAATGVMGTSTSGVGVFGRGGSAAGSFDGDVVVTGNIFGNGRLSAEGNIDVGGQLTVKGNVSVAGDIFLPGADCAEHFDVADGRQIEPGTVLVIDGNGVLRESTQAYDKRVAGVLSGAGEYRHAIVLDKRPSQENRVPVALVGKAYCKVDARYSPIQAGDLLTTSPTAGHAMKAIEPQKAFGSVIGKAIRGLERGQGLIPILIALQ